MSKLARTSLRVASHESGRSAKCKFGDGGLWSPRLRAWRNVCVCVCRQFLVAANDTSLFFSSVDDIALFPPLEAAKITHDGGARRTRRDATRAIFPVVLSLPLAWSDKLPIVTGGSEVFLVGENRTTPTLSTRARVKDFPATYMYIYPSCLLHLYLPTSYCLVNGGRQ